jgi:hypothetical protein
MILNKELDDLYSDVKEKGGLAEAIEFSLNEIGSSLVSEKMDFEIPFPIVYVRFEKENRFSQIYVAKERRLFIGDLWQDGICLGDVATDSLTDLARFLHNFLEVREKLFDNQSKFDFVSLYEKAKAFEEDKEIEWQWKSLKEYIPRDFPCLIPFLDIASKNEILNQLYPFTSMNTFHFSRCTGFPFTKDCPAVFPILNIKDELEYYEVRMPKTKQLVGKGNAEEVLQIVLDNLPKNCGRAVKGTAENFKE